jgi:hypothetical protein
MTIRPRAPEDDQQILDINIRLGYEPLPGSVEVLKELS